MSYFSDKSREECWEYLERHIALIPYERNQPQVKQFLLEKEENVQLSTLGGYLGHIKAFGVYLDDRHWLEASRDDVIMHIKTATASQGRPKLNGKSKGKPLGKYTKYQRMVNLREFYKWLLELDPDETPLQFKRMPFHKPGLEEQLEGREDRIRQDEVMSLLAKARDPRDRAIIMLLLDSGFRAGEVSALNIGDVEVDEYGATVMHTKEYHERSRGNRNLKGLKTGRRKVKIRLTVSVSYLKEWINSHPDRSNPDAPLFVSWSHKNLHGRLTASGIWSRITELSETAGLRHLHPHMFRHTAASLRSSDGWNEEMMRLQFGWSKGSPMPSYYSHVEDDYDAFALRKAGIPVPEKERETWLQRCEVCKTENPLDAVYCKGCHEALDA